MAMPVLAVSSVTCSVGSVANPSVPSSASQSSKSQPQANVFIAAAPCAVSPGVASSATIGAAVVSSAVLPKELGAQDRARERVSGEGGGAGEVRQHKEHHKLHEGLQCQQQAQGHQQQLQQQVVQEEGLHLERLGRVPSLRGAVQAAVAGAPASTVGPASAEAGAAPASDCASPFQGVAGSTATGEQLADEGNCYGCGGAEEPQVKRKKSKGAMAILDTGMEPIAVLQIDAKAHAQSCEAPFNVCNEVEAQAEVAGEVLGHGADAGAKFSVGLEMGEGQRMLQGQDPPQSSLVALGGYFLSTSGKIAYAVGSFAARQAAAAAGAAMAGAGANAGSPGEAHTTPWSRGSPPEATCGYPGPSSAPAVMWAARGSTALGNRGRGGKLGGPAAVPDVGRRGSRSVVAQGLRNTGVWWSDSAEDVGAPSPEVGREGEGEALAGEGHGGQGMAEGSGDAVVAGSPSATIASAGRAPGVGPASPGAADVASTSSPSAASVESLAGGAAGSGPSTSPDSETPFVNHGLIAWERRRALWRSGRSRSGSRSQQLGSDQQQQLQRHQGQSVPSAGHGAMATVEAGSRAAPAAAGAATGMQRGVQHSLASEPWRTPKIRPGTTYEDLLSSSRPFPEPIPLPEMVDFLVEVWQDEGLYD